jgi:uncharacterized membrane protein YukC
MVGIESHLEMIMTQRDYVAVQTARMNTMKWLTVGMIVANATAMIVVVKSISQVRAYQTAHTRILVDANVPMCRTENGRVRHSAKLQTRLPITND